MSKRVVRERIAMFVLALDGFSIHTFELTYRLTAHEYRHTRDYLFDFQKYLNLNQKVYKDKSWFGNGERYNCTLFQEYGVRISLEKNCNGGIDTFYLRMVINPRKLIEPDCSYLGILPPEKSSVKAVSKAFQGLFESLELPRDINDYQLSRIDLCTNIRCDNKKLFRELVRVLRKLPTPPKYERKYYEHKDRKTANKYNKHYLRFVCNTRELVIYDKTYQITENGLAYAYEKLPNGVLRFEVQNSRSYIRKVEKKLDDPSTQELLWHFIKTSRKEMIDVFSRSFPDTEFMKLESLEEKIRASYKGEKRDAMLALVQQLQRVQSVDKALKKVDANGYNTENLLKRFDRLGFSPIPLRKQFCAERLPGPVTLLRSVSDGDVLVKYQHIKYK